MKTAWLLFIVVHIASAQTMKDAGTYDASSAYPFGRYNPEAPASLKEFQPMIGVCDCRSVQRNPDGSWQDTLNMVWKFKYIMNGRSVQDETWHENGFTATSIRQFNTDSMHWVVSYYSSNFAPSRVSVWTGKKDGDKIVLNLPQKSPNGLDGFSRLTFYEMKESGFRWRGDWVDVAGKIVYPFWTIDCTRRR